MSMKKFSRRLNAVSPGEAANDTLDQVQDAAPPDSLARCRLRRNPVVLRFAGFRQRPQKMLELYPPWHDSAS
jgi:hypothetical protein